MCDYTECTSNEEPIVLSFSKLNLNKCNVGDTLGGNIEKPGWVDLKGYCQIQGHKHL